MKPSSLGLLPLLAAVASQPQSTAPVSQEKGMEQFTKDKEFHSAHTLREPSGEKLQGKDVTLTVGDAKVKCYWDAPKEGHDQVVLMVHEWWGLNDNIRETADKLQKETGYGVLAVDLYEGKVAKNADEAGKYMGAVDSTKASATINASPIFLIRRPRKSAMIGINVLSCTARSVIVSISSFCAAFLE